MLVPLANLKRYWVTKTVIKNLKMSLTQFVSNISHQHRFNLIFHESLQSILKFLENRFETLGMSNLLQSCIARYNNLQSFISEASDELLLEANRLVEVKSLLSVFSNYSISHVIFKKKNEIGEILSAS